MPRLASGLIVLIAAGGMMAGLLGAEIKDLQSWVFLTTPAFIGKSLMHVATVVGAYVAGQLIPTSDRLKANPPKE